MPPEPLHLPRPLVNQLLRAAQRATAFSQGWVLCDARGQFRLQPLPAEVDLLGTAARAPGGCAFAFYRSAKTTGSRPVAEEIEAVGQDTTLYLDIALDTRGVLQLRAWRIAAAALIATAVSITEPSAAAQ